MYALFEKGKNKAIGVEVISDENILVTAYVFKYKKNIKNATDIEDCEEIREVEVIIKRC